MDFTKQQEKRLKTRVKGYGITKEQLLELWSKQKGKCGICSEPMDLFGTGKSAIDHNHKTHSVRGILCYSCNMALGRFEKMGIDLIVEYLNPTDHIVVTDEVLIKKREAPKEKREVCGRPPIVYPKLGRSLTASERVTKARKIKSTGLDPFL